VPGVDTFESIDTWRNPVRTGFMDTFAVQDQGAAGPAPAADTAGRTVSVVFDAQRSGAGDAAAGLVASVVDGLAAAQGLGDDARAQWRHALLAGLDSGRRRQAEARALRDRAEQTCRTAEAGLSQAQGERRRLEMRLLNQRFDRLLTEPEARRQLHVAERAARSFGFADTLHTPARLVEVGRRLKAMRGVSGRITVAIRARFAGPGRSAVTALVLGLAARAVGVAPDLAVIGRMHLAAQGLLVPPLPADHVLQAALGFALALGWVACRVWSASRGLAAVASLRAGLAGVSLSSARCDEEAALLAGLVGADGAARRAQEALADAERLVAEAGAGLRRLMTGPAVADGRDLESLGESIAAGLVGSIDRLVLTVDDLDVCPPDRVNDVLLAVRRLQRACPGLAMAPSARSSALAPALAPAPASAPPPASPRIQGPDR
jgi:hypothetical protein